MDAVCSCHEPDARRPLIWVLALFALASFGAYLAFDPRFLLQLSSDGEIQSDTLHRLAVSRSGFSILAVAWAAGALITAVLKPRVVSGGARDFVFALVLSLQVLATGELALAVYYGGSYGTWQPYLDPGFSAHPDEEFGFLLDPGSRGLYHINSLGLRGPEIGQKSPDEFRIVTLGDSITFGVGSVEEITFQRRLESSLNRPGATRRYRVINAGMPGFSSHQAALLLEKRLLGLAPDLVIACIGWIDLSLAYSGEWTEAKANLGAMPDWDNRYSVSPAIRRAALALRTRFLPATLAAPPKTTGRPAADPRSVEHYKRNIARIMELCQSHGVKVLFWNIPCMLSRKSLSASEESKAMQYSVDLPTFEAFNRAMVTVCETRKVPVVTDIFSTDESGKDPFISDICHLLGPGHQVAARKLEGALRTTPGFLP